MSGTGKFYEERESRVRMGGEERTQGHPVFACFVIAPHLWV